MTKTNVNSDCGARLCASGSAIGTEDPSWGMPLGSTDSVSDIANKLTSCHRTVIVYVWWKRAMACVICILKNFGVRKANDNN
jgi:hypothetical protein